MAKVCKSQDNTCPNCAGNHTSKECVSTQVKCVNCESAIQRFKLNINSDHSVFDKKCPTYVRMCENEKRKTISSQ